MWDFFIVNVDNEFKKFRIQTSSMSLIRSVRNFWPETFGTEKKCLVQEGTEERGATSGGWKGFSRLGCRGWTFWRVLKGPQSSGSS